HSQAPPRPVDPGTPSWLLARSSPLWPVGPPGSLIPPAPPWSVIDRPPPWDSTPPALPHSSSSVRLLLPFGSTTAFQILSITLAHRLSVSTSGPTTTCTVAIVSPSSTMVLPSVGSTVGRLHACGLGPPAPNPLCLLPDSSCFLLDSSLHLLHPGLCSSSS
ncbi:hypothetical protein M9458_040179, partial [Cirrhinus mrigala]